MVDTTFLDELASKAPTPGGGGASAYVGAVAAALASMVGHLTEGKKTYAAVEPQVKEHLAFLEGLREQLLGLIDADAQAFTPLAAAYGMPKETPEQQQAKEQALQTALSDACSVPLQIMKVCCTVLDEADFMAHNGSKLAVSDAGASAIFARAAVEAASLNIFINTGTMADKELAARFEAQADELIAQANSKAQSIVAYVMAAIRK